MEGEGGKTEVFVVLVVYVDAKKFSSCDVELKWLICYALFLSFQWHNHHI